MKSLFVLFNTADRCAPQYYGLVFGYRGGVDCTDEILLVEDNELLTNDFAVVPYRWLFNKIINVLNKTDNALVTYHDSTRDNGYSHNGIHYHAATELKNYPPPDLRWGRDCLRFCKARPTAVFFVAQIEHNAAALSQHVCEIQRILLLVKSERLVSDFGFKPERGQSL